MVDSFDTLRVSLLPKIGPSRGRSLLQRFKSFQGICKASLSDLLTVSGINSAIAQGIHAATHQDALLKEIDKITEENIRLCETAGFQFIPFDHTSYPFILRKIYDPPLFLFIKGTLLPEDERALAVVGTRVPTDYGRQTAQKIVKALAEYNITVVSGLALGIDSVAHNTALEHGLRTIAVLGSGLNNIYPYSNGQLSERIVHQGCLISEFQLNAIPDAVNFPRRNRIISGLSLGTIVVESAMKGGAIITAELALDQNKEVFAVPGNISSHRSSGTNQLIKKGAAHMLTGISDILDELPSLNTKNSTQRRNAVQLSLIDQSIIAALEDNPVHIDDLANATGLPTSDLLVRLLQLEFKDVVCQLPGKHFSLVK